MTIQKLYLLDRNIIDLIKNYNKLKLRKVLSTSDSKDMLLNLLLKVDKKVNAVTPFFSIIEGQLGRQETAIEKAKCLKVETLEIGRFFKYAKNDCAFLLKKTPEISKLYASPAEETWVRDSLFLSESLRLLQDLPSPNIKERIKKEIFTLARKNEIPRHDLVVLICLICLYDIDDSTRIRKNFLKIGESLKTQNFYNLLNDLYVVSRMMLLKKTIVEKKLNLEIGFVTLDTTLNFIVKNINIFRDEKNIGKVHFYPELFPKLSRENYDALIFELNQRG